MIELDTEHLDTAQQTTQQQAVCPVCNARTMSYVGPDTISEDDGTEYTVFPWVCQACKSKGTEYHELKFLRHEIHKSVAA